MPDEIVFEVNGPTAERAEPIGLDEAGLREREHLQEWVVAHPDILGTNVRIVTTEYAGWTTALGKVEQDRLDVLALDQDGRLVVAELKRGRAPDTVEMQAIKYAAMASRFDPERLAAVHAGFLRQRGQDVTEVEALEMLNAHTQFALDAEKLRSPRIVLVASDYPANVTATVVWLSEMGVDISLVQFQAYRTSRGVVVTISRLYPVKDVEEFTVAPTRAGRRATGDDYPEVEWTVEDLTRLSPLVRPTVITALDLCSAAPGVLVPLSEIVSSAGRSQGQAQGDLAGLTMIVKRHFGRSNWPFVVDSTTGTAHYGMTAEQAERWRRASESTPSGDTPMDGAGIGDSTGQADGSTDLPPVLP